MGFGGGLGVLDVLGSDLHLGEGDGLGVGEEGSLDDRYVVFWLGLGVGDAGSHTVPLGGHTDGGESWNPVLILFAHNPG